MQGRTCKMTTSFYIRRNAKVITFIFMIALAVFCAYYLVSIPTVEGLLMNLAFALSTAFITDSLVLSSSILAIAVPLFGDSSNRIRQRYGSILLERIGLKRWTLTLYASTFFVFILSIIQKAGIIQLLDSLFKTEFRPAFSSVELSLTLIQEFGRVQTLEMTIIVVIQLLLFTGFISQASNPYFLIEMARKDLKKSQSIVPEGRHKVEALKESALVYRSLLIGNPEFGTASEQSIDLIGPHFSIIESMIEVLAKSGDKKHVSIMKSTVEICFDTLQLSIERRRVEDQKKFVRELKKWFAKRALDENRLDSETTYSDYLDVITEKMSKTVLGLMMGSDLSLFAGFVEVYPTVIWLHKHIRSYKTIKALNAFLCETMKKTIERHQKTALHITIHVVFRYYSSYQEFRSGEFAQSFDSSNSQVSELDKEFSKIRTIRDLSDRLNKLCRFEKYQLRKAKDEVIENTEKKISEMIEETEKEKKISEVRKSLWVKYTQRFLRELVVEVSVYALSRKEYWALKLIWDYFDDNSQDTHMLDVIPKNICDLYDLYFSSNLVELLDKSTGNSSFLQYIVLLMARPGFSFSGDLNEAILQTSDESIGYVRLLNPEEGKMMNVLEYFEKQDDLLGLLNISFGEKLRQNAVTCLKDLYDKATEEQRKRVGSPVEGKQYEV